MTPRPLTTTLLLVAGAALATAPAVQAQLATVPPRRALPNNDTGSAADTPSSGGDFEIGWMTVDGGGVFAVGADYELAGTIGQHDAGSSAGECYELQGGYWGLISGIGCYANCDGSTQDPILNVADFTCFLQKYAAGDCYANCDNSTQPPILNVADFTCYVQKYAAGCP